MAAASAPKASNEEEGADKLKALQDALLADSAEADQAVKQLQALQIKQNLESEITTTALQSAAENKQEVALAKGVADLKAQSATIEAREAMGGSESQIEQLKEITADLNRVDDLREERLGILDSKVTGVGPLDSIINEFRTMGIDNVIKAAESKAASSVAVLRDTSAGFNTIAADNLTARKTITEGTIAAGQSLIQQQATIAVSEQNMKNIQSNATAVKAIYDLGRRDLTNMQSAIASEIALDNAATAKVRAETAKKVQAEAEETSEARLAILKAQAAKLLREEELANTPASIAAATRKREAADEEIVLRTAKQAAVVKSVQVAQQALGGTQMTKAEILAGYELDPERFTKLYIAGSQATIDPTSGAVLKVPLADSAAEYLSIVGENPTALPDTRANALIQEVVIEVNEERARMIETGTRIKTDKLSQDALVNSVTNNLMKGYLKEIKTGDPTNPLRARPMDSLLTKAVLAEPLYQKVLKLKAFEQADPETIMKAAEEGMEAGLVSPEEAASGITTLYLSAIALNNKQNGGLERVGILPQFNYNARVEVPRSAVESVFDAAGTAIKLATVPVSAARGAVGLGGGVMSLGLGVHQTRTKVINMADETAVMGVLISRRSAWVGRTPVGLIPIDNSPEGK